MSNEKPEFPNYFDPDREAKAAAAEEVDAARTGRVPSHPIDPGAAAVHAGAATGQGVRDGMIEVDEFGDPVDPADPDLLDAYQAKGMSPEEAAQQANGSMGAQGPILSGFPFPGIGGRTQGGMEWRVGGCCLPIPLLMGVVGLGASLVLGRRGRA